MKYLITILLLSIQLYAQAAVDSIGTQEKTGTSPLLSFGMIFFGLLTFVPYIYLTIKEKSKKKP